MRNKIYIIMLLAALIAVSGCANKKKISPAKQTPKTEKRGKDSKTDRHGEAAYRLAMEQQRIQDSIAHAEAARLLLIEQQRIADSIAAAEVAKRAQIQTLNIPRVTIIVEMQGRQVSSPAAIKWQRGTGLSVSLQPFIGMEMFRFELSEQGLTVIDKINRQYAFLSYEQLGQMGAQMTLEQIDGWIDEQVIGRLDEPQITLQALRMDIKGTAIIYTSSVQKDIQLNMRPTNISGYRQVSADQLVKSL